MFYFIEPEVAGGWGSNTIADTSSHPPIVSKFHYQFDGWLGDDLLESFPCFIVSEPLKDDLISSGLTGFEIEGAEVSKSEDFWSEDTYSNLPKFYWLKVSGEDLFNDFKIAADYRLVVSDKALSVIRRHNINHADITPI